jgi:CheY-like chemotaxis protein
VGENDGAVMGIVMSMILVLEDDPANLQVFTALLWAKGEYVLEASTAREALDAARRNGELNLLVSDVALKGDEMSGAEVATILLDSQEKLPIVFVTGTPLDLWDEPDRRKLNALRLRTDVAVLEKPFMPSAFESAVATMLHEAPATHKFRAASAPKMAAAGINARLTNGPERT